jgi:hypothetical protein
MDNGFTNKLEALEDWSEELDYKIDLHLEYLRTKEPVKRAKPKALYRKAERVCDILAKTLCDQALK